MTRPALYVSSLYKWMTQLKVRYYFTPPAVPLHLLVREEMLKVHVECIIFLKCKMCESLHRLHLLLHAGCSSLLLQAHCNSCLLITTNC